MKSKILLILILSFATNFLSGQTNSDWNKFEAIKNVNSDDPAKLSELITQKYDDELDKIKAIYYWVASNIKYDYKALEKLRKEKPSREKYTLEQAKKKYDKDLKTALKRKKGVCQQYSMIFKALCENSGIESEFVAGWAKNNPKSSGMGESHAWNAVKYNNEWHLVDVTFGSGYTDENHKFQFNFDPNYFFTDKDVFLLNHYPKDKQWQLTDEYLEKEVYKTHPYVGSGFINYGISELTPMTKSVTYHQEEDLEISFKAANKITEGLICYNMKTGKKTKLQVNEDKNNYLLKLETTNLRNGHYIFTTDSNKTLFSFKLKMK